MKFIIFWTMRPEIRPRAHFSIFSCFWHRLGMLEPPGIEKHSCPKAGHKFRENYENHKKHENRYNSLDRKLQYL